MIQHPGPSLLEKFERKFKTTASVQKTCNTMTQACPCIYSHNYIFTSHKGIQFHSKVCLLAVATKSCVQCCHSFFMYHLIRSLWNPGLPTHQSLWYPILSSFLSVLLMFQRPLDLWLFYLSPIFPYSQQDSVFCFRSQISVLSSGYSPLTFMLQSVLTLLLFIKSPFCAPQPTSPSTNASCNYLHNHSYLTDYFLCLEINLIRTGSILFALRLNL